MRASRYGPPSASVATSLGFFVAGAFILLIGLGVLPAEVSVPVWVLILCAGAFLLASLLPLTIYAGDRVTRLGGAVGCLMVLVFTVLANWVAFGPGRRKGSFDVALPLFVFGMPETDAPIRIAFAVSAVILDALSIAIIFNGIRSLIRHAR